jgi:hypothetical protein
LAVVEEEREMTDDIHTHRCGLHLTPHQLRDASDPPLSVKGCGWEWEHARVYKSAEDYANRHRCPNCGEGPWYARVLLREQRLATFIEAPRIDESLLLQATEAELVVIAGALLDALGFDEARFVSIEANLRGFRRGR